jgi:hypothetical protein
MRSTVIEDVEEIGMVIDGSTVDIESTVIRDVAALPSGTTGGRGIGVQYRQELSVRSEVTLRRSLIERSAEAGLTVTASDMVIESTAIRESGPRPDGIQGIGVLVQHDVLGKPGQDTRSTAAIRWSVIETTHLAGVMIFGSTATLDDTLVRDSKPQSNDARFGDGVVVIGADVKGSATLKHVRVEQSARVGVANFGGSMSVGDTTIECAGIPLAGERLSDGAGIHEPLFTDAGGNLCGCEADVSACIVQSSNLGAPAALPP